LNLGISFTPLVPTYVVWAAVIVAVLVSLLIVFGRSRGALMRTLALALFGVLMQLALALLYRALAGAIGGSLLAVVWQQLIVLAWLWIKLLRLAWAAAYVRAADGLDVRLGTDVALPAV